MAKDEGLKESETVLNQPQNQRFVLRDHDGNKKLTVREVLMESIAYLTYRVYLMLTIAITLHKKQRLSC